MNLGKIKFRSQKPKVSEDLQLITSISDVDTFIKSVDRYFDTQNKAYNELRALHGDESHDVFTVSGIVNVAKTVEEGLEWSGNKLTDLVNRKRELIEENRSEIEGYEFKPITKPTIM